MKNIIFIFSISIFFSNFALADDYMYVDKYESKIDKQQDKFIKKFVDKCISDEKLDKTDCNKLAKEKADDKYPSRGSDKYIETHYKNLDRKGAKKAAIEVLELYKKIESQPSGNWSGKVHDYDLDTEAGWLAEHKLGILGVQDAVSLMPYVGVDY